MGYLDAEGEEKVRQGISGYHHESILKHRTRSSPRRWRS
jgi:hypothetical protein